MKTQYFVEHPRRDLILLVDEQYALAPRAYLITTRLITAIYEALAKMWHEAATPYIHGALTQIVKDDGLSAQAHDDQDPYTLRLW